MAGDTAEPCVHAALAPQDLVALGCVDHANNGDRRVRRCCGRICAGDRTAISQGLDPDAVKVVHLHLPATSKQVRRHAAAHVAGADDTDTTVGGCN